jgi:RIO kinase 1
MESRLSQPESEARFASRETDAADMRAIQEFLDEALVSEVLNVIKSGKEATVYRCRADPSLGVDFAAAKVYHSANHRSFQRSAVYEEGRQFGPGQVQRAIKNRSEFGREAQLAFWVEHEFEVLSALHYAGADVPAPFACTEKAILMEFVGDEDGDSPQLQYARFADGEAEKVLERILWNIELMVRENVVHGDLSAFNMLYHEGQVRIIDFPQAVDPRKNSSARDLLQRDISNVVEFFQRRRAGLEREPERMARNLWNLWKYGEVLAMPFPEG